MFTHGVFILAVIIVFVSIVFLPIALSVGWLSAIKVLSATCPMTVMLALGLVVISLFIVNLILGSMLLSSMKRDREELSQS